MPREAKKTAALYLRVSTNEGKQTVENQRMAINQWCEQNNYRVVQEYVDEESGGKGRKQRAELDRLFKHVAGVRTGAESPKFQTLVFWSLDRLTREGALATLNYLAELKEAGFDYVSLQEQYIDSTGLFAPAVIGIIATVASMERERMAERIKAGINRKRTQDGGAWGRKPTQLDHTEFAALRAKGLSYTQLQKHFKVGRSTVARVLRECKALGIDTSPETLTKANNQD